MSSISKLVQLLENRDKIAETTYKILIKNAPAGFRVIETTPLEEIINKYQEFYIRTIDDEESAKVSLVN